MIVDLYEPEAEFSAGRAAMVVWQYKDNAEFKERATEVLDHFKHIVQFRYQDKLQELLVENIPGIKEIFEWPHH